MEAIKQETERDIHIYLDSYVAFRKRSLLLFMSIGGEISKNVNQEMDRYIGYGQIFDSITALKPALDIINLKEFNLEKVVKISALPSSAKYRLFLLGRLQPKT